MPNRSPRTPGEVWSLGGLCEVNEIVPECSSPQEVLRAGSCEYAACGCNRMCTRDPGRGLAPESGGHSPLRPATWCQGKFGEGKGEGSGYPLFLAQHLPLGFQESPHLELGSTCTDD